MRSGRDLHPHARSLGQGQGMSSCTWERENGRAAIGSGPLEPSLQAGRSLAEPPTARAAAMMSLLRDIEELPS